ncbi:hypothetical protein ACIGXG_33735 [Streptomyces goshikiensis]|uniref:hypothetical protein n=1 Tax=Streptomyces goshikiensis TaxID=1942 RepID=UPI0037D2A6F3
MTSLIRKIAVGAVFAAAAISLPALTSSISSAAPGTPAATSADTPPFAIEDFSYPNADRILTEKGIKLIKGDGRLLLADCNPSVPQIKVRTVSDAATGRAGAYCFAATSASGFLTLEVPRVTSLETADRPISADLIAEGQKKTIDVAQDDFKPVGEGDLPSGAKRSLLVELRVTG